MAARKRAALGKKQQVPPEEIAEVLRIGEQLLAMGANGGPGEFYTRKVLAEKGWSPLAIDRILLHELPWPRETAAEFIDRPVRHDRVDKPTASSSAFQPPNVVIHPPMRTGEVELAMGALEREVDRLFGEVNDLIGHLGPVLTPPTPSAVNETEPARPSFPMTAAELPGHIVDIARKCAAAGDHVVAAMKRLQV